MLLALACAEKAILPVAATAVVVGSPNSALSQKLVPPRSSGISIWPSSVARRRLGVLAVAAAAEQQILAERLA
jgi:hypothetical protein